MEGFSSSVHDFNYHLIFDHSSRSLCASFLLLLRHIRNWIHPRPPSIRNVVIVVPSVTDRPSVAFHPGVKPLAETFSGPPDHPLAGQRLLLSAPPSPRASREGWLVSCSRSSIRQKGFFSPATFFLGDPARSVNGSVLTADLRTDISLHRRTLSLVSTPDPVTRPTSPPNRAPSFPLLSFLPLTRKGPNPPFLRRAEVALRTDIALHTLAPTSGPPTTILCLSKPQRPFQRIA